MKKERLTLVPIGGLTDRLKVVASAITMALDAGREMEIIWFSNERLYCPSYRLFTLAPVIKEAGITIREARGKDWFFNDRPHSGNGYLSYPFVFFRYDKCVSPKEIETVSRSTPDRLKDYFIGGERILLASTTSFGDHRRIFKDLEATVEVKNAFRSNLSGWTENVVGVHLDGDQQQDRQNHIPIELFIKRMQALIEEDPGVSFFIASDMEEERERLSVIFSGRILMPHTLSSMNTPKGCINAFGELLALAQTKHILSTKGGSFAQVASLIGDIPLETLSIYSE